MMDSDSSKRILKILHFGGIAWFFLNAGFLLVVALRQAGVSWWVVFSVSGYSAVVMLFLLAVYLFAIFNGAVQSKIRNEHPLTTSEYYMAFYDLAPFLGVLAGVVGQVGLTSPIQRVTTIATGTLAATFMMWIVVDPLVSLIEANLPRSRKLRHERRTAARAQKRKEMEDSRRLLDELFEREKEYRLQWQQLLEPLADELVDMLCRSRFPLRERRARLAEIGGEAWRIGGITCMRYLHEMTLVRLRERGREELIDHVAIAWDGIGTWRRPRTEQILRSFACVPDAHAATS